MRFTSRRGKFARLLLDLETGLGASVSTNSKSISAKLAAGSAVMLDAEVV